MSILRDIVAMFTVEVDDTKLSKFDQQVNKNVENLKKWALGAAAAVGVVQGIPALVGGIQDMAKAADDLGDTAERLNISTGALQAWNYAAELSGSSAEEFQGSIGHLVRSLAEAGEGNKDAAAAFKKLGVETKDAHGKLRRVEDVLPDLAEGMSKIPNATERSALAFKVLGRGALPLVPLLSKGKDAVMELREEFEQLGGGIDEETVGEASEYADQLTRLGVITQTLHTKVLAFLIPAMDFVVSAMMGATNAINYLIDKTKVFEAVFLIGASVAAGFAGAWVAANAAILVSFIATWAPIIATWAAVAAAIAGVVLLVEDILQLFDGGKSVVGDFIDSLFGLGAAEEMVINLKRGFEDLVYWAQRGKAALGGDFSGDGLETPEQKVERRRNEAVSSGNVDDFVKDRAAGRTKEQGVQDFLAHRAKFLESNPEAVTDKDVGAGLATQDQLAVAQKAQAQASESVVVPRASTATAPREAKRGTAKNVNYQGGPVNIVLQGSDEAQAARVRQVIQEERDKDNRALVAALAEESL